MVDARFFKNAGPFSLGDLAARLGGELAASTPADFQVSDIATLDDASGAELAMFSDPRYRDTFQQSRAGAVITSKEITSAAPPGGAHLIFVKSPRAAFAEAAWLFYPQSNDAFAVDASSTPVNASLGENCRINPTAIIGENVKIGARTEIGAHAVIGRGVVIGDDCIIGPNTTISHAVIGSRVHIYPGAVIGIQGFGFVPGPRGIRRIPQLGRVMLGDDIEIGANCAIDRGTVGDTVIGQGTVLDNLVHIGHNVRIGRFCIIAGQVGMAGSSEIGDGVMMGGQVGIADHLTIGAGAQIAGHAGVTRDVAPGAKVAGYPAIPVQEWHRQTIGLKGLFRHKP